MGTLRIILDGDLTEAQVTQFFEGEGFRVLRRTPQTQDMPLEIIFGDTDAEARFVEDHFICVRYVDLIGPKQRALAGQLRTSLPFVGDRDILQQSADESLSVQDQVDWLMLATALGETSHRAEVKTLITKAMHSNEAPKRHAALICAGWLQWTEFSSEIEILTQDPVPDVRDYAQLIQQGFEQNN